MTYEKIITKKEIKFNKKTRKQQTGWWFTVIGRRDLAKAVGTAVNNNNNDKRSEILIIRAEIGGRAFWFAIWFSILAVLGLKFGYQDNGMCAS